MWGTDGLARTCKEISTQREGAIKANVVDSDVLQANEYTKYRFDVFSTKRGRKVREGIARVTDCEILRQGKVNYRLG